MVDLTLNCSRAALDCVHLSRISLRLHFQHDVELFVTELLCHLAICDKDRENSQLAH